MVVQNLEEKVKPATNSKVIDSNAVRRAEVIIVAETYFNGQTYCLGKDDRVYIPLGLDALTHPADERRPSSYRLTELTKDLVPESQWSKVYSKKPKK